MNKITSNLFTKRSWGDEVIWALTDSYMAKTIEMPKDTQSPLFFNDDKDRSIIIIMGNIKLFYGLSISDVKSYTLSEGWSWHIDKGAVYKYQSFDNPIRLIEVSTPHLENNTILKELDTFITYTPPKEDISWRIKEVVKPKRRGRKPKKND